ncbi:MAG: hypothetical protein IKR11_09510 [Solobacterium sp.]|nr:hypothetical protein [Solobacterium sp.]
MKMKKILKILASGMLIMAMSGCTKITQDLQTRLNEKIAFAESVPASSPTYRKPYYAYYVEPSVGRLSSDELSNMFLYDNIRFVMSLNVSNIINEKYYQNIEADLTKNVLEDAVVASMEGTYKDFENHELTYAVKVCRLANEYFTIFHTRAVDFYALSDIYSIPDVCAKMLLISKSVHVNQDTILANYSTQEAISYEGKTVKLFEDISPESGKIEDLFVSGNSAGAGASGFAEYVNEGEEYHAQIEGDEEIIDEEEEISTDDNE